MWDRLSFADLGMATSMIDSISNAYSIHPDPLLGLVTPDRLELLLTNRAVGVCKSLIIGHWNPRNLLRLRGAVGLRDCSA